MPIRYTRDLIMTVKEMFLERHWGVVEIASKLSIDPSDVSSMIEIVKQMVS